MNFIGSKKYIEDSLDNSENSPLADALFVMSLESLAAKDQSGGLYMHVSKVPKDKTPTANYFKSLKDSLDARGRANGVTMIHKKINLGDEMLAWEHERFSFRRLAAFTVSASATHKLHSRSSMFDTCDDVNLDSLVANIELIAEALASQAFPQARGKDADAIKSELKVSPAYVRTTFKQICSQARSPQLLLTKQKSKDNFVVAPFVATLESLLKKSVKNTGYKHFKLDQREPEVVFYEPQSATLNVYNVKHAMFDLVISTSIALYLVVFYYVLTYFDVLATLVKSLKSSRNRKSAAPANGVSRAKQH